jgi:hypothetical protein
MIPGYRVPEDGVMKVKTLLMLTLVAGAAHGAANCQSGLTLADVAAAMGPKVTLQPVLSNQKFRGWRLYNIEGAKQLEALGIAPGTLMTHVCGKLADEVIRNGGTLCCDQDASISFEVKFRVMGAEKTAIITR